MKNKLLQFIAISLFMTGFLTAISVEAQNRPYRVSDRQVQTLLDRIETRTDAFKGSLNSALDQSTLNGTKREDNINDFVSDFENATDDLRERFNDRKSVNGDVQEVLNRAAYIDRFMTSNRLNTATQRNWRNIRTDLATLAGYYNVSFDLTVRNTDINTAYRVSDSQVQTLLERIETRTDTFKGTLNRALDQSRINGTDREDNINEFVSNFEKATDDLRGRFDDRKSVNTDVQEVLTRAAYINRFMTNNRLNSTAQRNWRDIRTDLSTLAGYYNVSFDLSVQPTNTGNTAFRGSERDVRNLLAQLEQRTDAYNREMQNALDRSFLNNTRSETTIAAYLNDFETATGKLKQNFDARRSTSADVQEVLSRANFIDGVMRDYRFTPNAENQWRLINTDLKNLATFYNVSTNYDRPYSPIGEFDTRLTGTYRLNTSQSDDVNDVVGRAIGVYQANQRPNLSTNLQRRLASPEMLAIEKRSQEVTIASSNSPQVNFQVDGAARTETTNNGRIIKVTASNYYDGVALSYEGDRINDFYVNFIPQSNGQLRVVRRVYLENRNETITVASVYDKTDKVARFSDVNNNNQNSGSLSNDFIIPNNTRLTAVLRTPISTKVSKDGDRFRMEITSPSQFDGAIIEGRVVKAERSGQVTGRANVSLDFDTIRLQNGTTYKFAGIVDEVTMANGDKVSVTNEGTVRDSSQTTKTVTRAGIGAAIGALIGAIAGGGSGAAIGAGIGAGAGAGSVVLQGRDDIELTDGAQFMITASAPGNVVNNQ